MPRQCQPPPPLPSGAVTLGGLSTQKTPEAPRRSVTRKRTETHTSAPICRRERDEAA